VHACTPPRTRVQQGPHHALEAGAPRMHRPAINNRGPTNDRARRVKAAPSLVRCASQSIHGCFHLPICPACSAVPCKQEHRSMPGRTHLLPLLGRSPRTVASLCWSCQASGVRGYAVASPSARSCCSSSTRVTTRIHFRGTHSGTQACIDQKVQNRRLDRSASVSIFLSSCCNGVSA
jgi:hypothetical protein